MALRVLALLVAALVVPAAGAGCDFDPKAKLRFFVGWKFSAAGRAASTATINTAMNAWISPCNALAYAMGAAVSTNPAAYGMTSIPAGAAFADYGMWSDWESMDDIIACYAQGMKAGTTQALKKYYSLASRLILPLKGGGNPKAACTSPPGSLAPAGYRYMFWYLLKDNTPATCKAATSLLDAIVATAPYVRYAGGCDLSPEGPTSPMPNTADFGGSVDFKTAADVAAWLSNTPAKANRAAIRNLAASSTRLILPLPAVPMRGTGAVKGSAAATAAATKIAAGAAAAAPVAAAKSAAAVPAAAAKPKAAAVPVAAAKP